MESKKYLEDISEIKNLMNRSSRFISLSGLSGVMAGIYALIGAAVALFLFNTVDYSSSSPFGDLQLKLYLVAASVLALAIITGFLLTYSKAKKSGERIWDVTSRRLVINFLIPLITGGGFSFVLLQYGFYGLIAPATLVFYGLAIVNASKYTIGEVRYMGISFIILGLIATQFLGYGLYFWAIGFGFFHIIYGALMWFKHERK